MTDEPEKKFYWLRLKKDFFKRHDIRIIESQENGPLYILFYLKLLVESLDHNGRLRFSDTIPYDEKMLSTITGTNIDIVRTAIRIFAELEMMSVLDDGTYHLMQVEAMTGSESKWAENKRNYRQRKQLENNEDNVQTKIGHVRQEYRDKSIDNIHSEKSKKHFVKPTFDEVNLYCRERLNTVDAQAFIDHYESNGWMVGRNKMKNWQAAVRTWEKHDFTKNESSPKAKNETNRQAYVPRINEEAQALIREREQQKNG